MGFDTFLSLLYSLIVSFRALQVWLRCSLWTCEQTYNWCS